jgi:hypothetical protein
MFDIFCFRLRFLAPCDFVVVSGHLQIFKTFWLKSETSGFENGNSSTRMRPLENLSACPAVAGLQFAQMVRGWDQSQPA